ncbi:hypothetical protein [Thermaerobacter composti]|uniref:DUF2938 domain-containing protein n=1 Tax=Thermaerobacter composti TaxID=554949 RepID=A0ABZ0QPL7_9FIRM|nr:hypothetical protein [Thermaerobacter composti]WPD19439.1 hypothetical protein Q5761_01870 [Thermaerobacter composti]
MSPVRGVPTARVVAAGLIAGLVQIATVYVLQPIVGTQRGTFTRFVADGLGMGDGRTMAQAAMSLGGLAALLVAAVLWAFVYRAVAPAGNAVTGMAFGLAIWLAGALVVLPVLAAAGAAPSPGFLGTGFSGARSALVAAIAHLVYGGVLGSMLGAPRGAET